MSTPLDEATQLCAQLLAQRWLPRKHPLVKRALIDSELWQSVQDRLAQTGLRLVDNLHADHVTVALLRETQPKVFGEAGLNANNNFELPRDGVSLLIVLWSLIILPKRERQAARASSADDGQSEMFKAERPLPSAAQVSPALSYKALLADFGAQLGKKVRIDGNLKRLESQGFITRKGDDICEGPLLDLLLDYDILAPRILDGVLGEVLAKTKALAQESKAAAEQAQEDNGREDTEAPDANQNSGSDA